MTTDEPPEEITYTLAEANLLLWDLSPPATPSTTWVPSRRWPASSTR
jgi:hypothetical protein